MTDSTLASPLLTPAADGTRQRFWSAIAEQLADGIGRGTYQPGSRLPSEHALADLFGVNRHTIRRSLASLSSQGLVRITQGSGTYVEEFAVDLMLGRRTRHRENLSTSGLHGQLQVLAAEHVRASAGQAKALALPARSKLLRLEVLGDADGRPIHYSERFFPATRFDRLEAVVRATGSITAAFAAHGVADYTRQESRITAQLPTPAVAAQLRQPVERPVLLVESVNIDTAGVPIEFASTWFAGDRVKLTVVPGA